MVCVRFTTFYMLMRRSSATSLSHMYVSWSLAIFVPFITPWIRFRGPLRLNRFEMPGKTSFSPKVKSILGMSEND